MRASSTDLLDLLMCLGCCSVDKIVGAAFPRQFQFIIRHIHGSDLCLFGFRQLNCEMAKPADPKDRDFLTGLHVGGFDRRVDCQSCAHQRGRFFKTDIAGELCDMACFSFDELCETAVNRAACNLLFSTECLATDQTELAFTASPMQPRHSGTITDRKFTYPFADSCDSSRDFVAEDEWKLRDRF